MSRYLFAYKAKDPAFDAAIAIGTGVGSKLAELSDKMTPGQGRALMILGVGGAIATYLFVTAAAGAAGTGRTLAACGVTMLTLAIGAIAEGNDKAGPT